MVVLWIQIGALILSGLFWALVLVDLTREVKRLLRSILQTEDRVQGMLVEIHSWGNENLPVLTTMAAEIPDEMRTLRGKMVELMDVFERAERSARR